eukprot:XP_011667846.1 PREDICTED: mucin-5AC-like [Strongylocentrotus purpuratus]
MSIATILDVSTNPSPNKTPPPPLETTPDPPTMSTASNGSTPSQTSTNPPTMSTASDGSTPSQTSTNPPTMSTASDGSTPSQTSTNPPTMSTASDESTPSQTSTNPPTMSTANDGSTPSQTSTNPPTISTASNGSTPSQTSANPPTMSTSSDRSTPSQTSTNPPTMSTASDGSTPSQTSTNPPTMSTASDGSTPSQTSTNPPTMLTASDGSTPSQTSTYPPTMSTASDGSTPSQTSTAPSTPHRTSSLMTTQGPRTTVLSAGVSGTETVEEMNTVHVAGETTQKPQSPSTTPERKTTSSESIEKQMGIATISDVSTNPSPNMTPPPAQETTTNPPTTSTASVESTSSQTSIASSTPRRSSSLMTTQGPTTTVFSAGVLRTESVEEMNTVHVAEETTQKPQSPSATTERETTSSDSIWLIGSRDPYRTYAIYKALYIPPPGTGTPIVLWLDLCSDDIYISDLTNSSLISLQTRVSAFDLTDYNSPETPLSTFEEWVGDIAFDSVDKKIYLLSIGSKDEICSETLDGQDYVCWEITVVCREPSEIDIDMVGRKLYCSCDKKIISMNLDGTAMRTDFTHDEARYIEHLAVTHTAVFWATEKKIQRKDSQGTDTLFAAAADNEICGLSVDFIVRLQGPSTKPSDPLSTAKQWAVAPSQTSTNPPTMSTVSRWEYALSDQHKPIHSASDIQA